MRTGRCSSKTSVTVSAVIAPSQPGCAAVSSEFRVGARQGLPVGSNLLTSCLRRYADVYAEEQPMSATVAFEVPSPYGPEAATRTVTLAYARVGVGEPLLLL